MGNKIFLDAAGEKYDPDETWYLPRELELKEERAKSLDGVPMFLRRPEFEEKDVEDPPRKFKKFKPNKTSSCLNLTENVPDDPDIPGVPVYDSFDDRVLLEDKPVPRGGPMRKLVPAHPCDTCGAFFKAVQLDAASIQSVCRHRAWNPRPRTPPNFWNVGWHSPEKKKRATAALRKSLTEICCKENEKKSSLLSQPKFIFIFVLVFFYSVLKNKILSTKQNITFLSNKPNPKININVLKNLSHTCEFSRSPRESSSILLSISFHGSKDV